MWLLAESLLLTLINTTWKLHSWHHSCCEPPKWFDLLLVSADSALTYEPKRRLKLRFWRHFFFFLLTSGFGWAEILTVVINLFLSIKFTHFLGSHVMQFYRVLFILPQRKMQEICNFLHIKSSSVLAQCLQLWHYYAQT